MRAITGHLWVRKVSRSLKMSETLDHSGQDRRGDRRVGITSPEIQFPRLVGDKKVPRDRYGWVRQPQLS